MRTAAVLIDQVRLLSRNVMNNDGTFGITDAEVLQYLNDGQDRLQNLISATKNIGKIFVTEKIISLVANQEAYEIPDRVLLNKQIEQVEFSASGLLTDYVLLEKLSMFNRDTNTSTYPWGYFKRGNRLMLQPTPSASTGSLRVSYERELDDLALATDTVNGTPSGTSVVVTTGSTSFVSGAYINIENVDGVILLRNGLISSYNGGTKTITLSANVSTYLEGSATLAGLASQSVQIGKWVTRISKLPDACERYLVHYGVAQMFKKDASRDYTRQAELVQMMEEDILEALAAQTSEVEYIPQLNRYEYW